MLASSRRAAGVAGLRLRRAAVVRLSRGRAGRRPKGYPRPDRVGVRRWVPSWRHVVRIGLFGVACLVGLLGYVYHETKIPTDLKAFAIQQNNVYFWADGTEMARTGEVNRQDIPLDQVPQGVQWAALAAENETFYSDYGVDPQGMARAVRNMATGGAMQGGSTITQQYVKNAYLNQKQTMSRKLTEIVLAVKLDRKLSKQQILEGYLNTSWYGRGSYGIERAAQAYYGEDVSQLNVSQGAVLASLLKGAGRYDPAISPENHKRAVDRWKWILDRMVVIGKLTPAQRAAYTTFPEPQEPPKQVGLSGQTGYLVDIAKQYVTTHTGITDAQFDLGGYQIHTTFEKPSQTALTDAVQAAAARQNADPGLRVGAASVASDGRMLAVYGGPDYLRQGYDNANSALVPSGSAFTPFVYAAALSQGVQRQLGAGRTPVSPTTPYDGDNQIPVQTPEGPYWDRDGHLVKGTNDGGKSWGSISLLTAMEQSVNTPLMQLGLDTGLDQVRQTALGLGLLPDSLGAQVPAFSLGTSTPSAIRMADAYTAFADGGMHTDPYSVLRITRDGAPVDVQKPAPARALSQQVAQQVDAALTGTVQEGTGRGAQVPGRTVAGKTGTTQDNRAGWFVGYSGQVSTAVAVFRLDPKSVQALPLDGQGDPAKSAAATAYPLDIWSTYVKSVSAD
ncbi:membrane peptidoglycan carboxypeptidase [Kitasatospora sp. GAS204A]|uniref:transglycosylase domain-containing protein n=1 Tax=unclassified Kitasatospora TaxID=2633591 RepID=UPI002472EEE9|nr:transglycosylase domain-containing protein [Kitasatospora sp. GAS204B]MDH6117020.1 membrane peptidoglycan carboxypeptidase [Kitasatospora sp. GAS204B]